jgi:hypothetical protein
MLSIADGGAFAFAVAMRKCEIWVDGGIQVYGIGIRTRPRKISGWSLDLKELERGSKVKDSVEVFEVRGEVESCRW